MSISNYESPSTPGLLVTFKNYLIELICFNNEKNLEPRFWKYSGQYWQDKYGRENKGTFLFIKESQSKKFEENDTLFQKCSIRLIKSLNIKSLVNKKNRYKLLKNVIDMYANEQQKINNKQEEKQFKTNNTFISVGKKTMLSKIKDIEIGKIQI